MHHERYSLRQRLLVRLWVPLFGVLLLGAVVAFVLARHIGSVIYDRWLYDSAMALAEQLKVQDGRVELGLSKHAVELFEWDSVDRIYEEVFSNQHGVIFSNASFPAAPEPLTLNKAFFYDSIINHQTVRVVALSMVVPQHNKETIVIRVAETKQKRGTLVTDIILQSVPFQIVLLILTTTFIWLAVTSSLRTLNILAKRLEQYEPDGLIPFDNIDQLPSEVLPLVHSINQLIAKLSEAQSTQRRFIDNAAHQMRTPLAALQVQAERALREPDVIKHQDALQQILTALSRMRHVTQQMLTLARSEHSVASSLSMIPVDLAILARETLEAWTDTAISKQVDLGYEGPEQGIVIQGEPLLLKELIGNLIDNAIRYGAKEGVVTLGLLYQPLTLYVEDNGPGIPTEERLLVLERFYRRRTTQESGCGLGLAIAQEIAMRHHATLTIHPASEAKTGTRITIVFSETCMT